MRSAAPFRVLTLIGYFGIWALLPAWYLWLEPATGLPTWFLAFLLVPLLFPLPGLVRGRVYTYKWSLFLSLLYLLHGVGEAWTLQADRLYGLAEVVLSLLWFGGAIGYVRRSRTTSGG